VRTVHVPVEAAGHPSASGSAAAAHSRRNGKTADACTGGGEYV
jgi:hypothetical protein